jgi:hypothetical protein
MKRYLLIILGGLAIVFVGLGACKDLQAKQNEKQGRTLKKEVQMRVDFYKIDRKHTSKGEYLGYAEIKDGKLYINVKDSKLEELLNKPYTTMRGEMESGRIVDYAVTLQPGTIEQLKAIATECWQFGYIGEIVKE